MFIHLCIRAVVYSCSCTLVHAPLHYRISLCSYALVPLCLHNCTHLCMRALVHSCACTFVHSCLHYLVQLFSYALVRLRMH